LIVLANVSTLGDVSREAVLRALAEPRRQAILRLVRDRARSVGEIGEHFEISQQAVSQHLQVLADAGLVDVKRDGRRRLYLVNPNGLEVLERFLSELWPAGLRRLKKAVESNRGR
jgi:DNA-binding transcriptional ArsR family regulator